MEKYKNDYVPQSERTAQGGGDLVIQIGNNKITENFKFNKFLNPSLLDYISSKDASLNIEPSQYISARLSDLELKDLICVAKNFNINNCDKSSKLYTEQELTRALLHKTIEKITTNDDVSKDDIGEVLKFMKKCRSNDEASNNIDDIYVEHCYYYSKLLKLKYNIKDITDEVLHQISAVFDLILKNKSYMHITHVYEANLRDIIENVTNDTSIKLSQVIQQNMKKILVEISEKSKLVNDINKIVNYEQATSAKTLLKILNDIGVDKNDNRTSTMSLKNFNSIIFCFLMLYEQTLSNDLNSINDTIKFILIDEYVDLFKVYVTLLNSNDLNDVQKKIVMHKTQVAVECITNLMSNQTQKELWQCFNTIDKKEFKKFSTRFINLWRDVYSEKVIIFNYGCDVKNIQDPKNSVTMIRTVIDVFSKFYKITNINEIIDTNGCQGSINLHNNLKMLFRCVEYDIKGEGEEISKIDDFLKNFLIDQKSISENNIIILSLKNIYSMLVQFKNTKNTQMTTKIFHKVLMVYKKTINKNELCKQDEITQIYMYLCCIYGCLAFSILIDSGYITIADELSMNQSLDIATVVNDCFRSILHIIQQNNSLLSQLNQCELNSILDVYEALSSISIEYNALSSISMEYNAAVPFIDKDYINTITNIRNESKRDIDINLESPPKLQMSLLDDFMKLHNQLMEEKKQKEKLQEKDYEFNKHIELPLKRFQCRSQQKEEQKNDQEKTQTYMYKSKSQQQILQTLDVQTGGDQKDGGQKKIN